MHSNIYLFPAIPKIPNHALISVLRLDCIPSFSFAAPSKISLKPGCNVSKRKEDLVTAAVQERHEVCPSEGTVSHRIEHSCPPATNDDKELSRMKTVSILHEDDGVLVELPSSDENKPESKKLN